MRRAPTWRFGGLVAALVLSSACSGDPPQPQQRLSGQIRIDGSSTVGPVMEQAAEMFRSVQPRVRISVGKHGTGGGFKKFLEEKASLRIDIANASRPIDRAELDQAAQRGVEFIELPIAIDALTVVVHKDNTFCEHLTVAELKRIWEPDSKINNWKDVRAGFPDLPLKLYGPGPDSGTFDYFTEVIVGQAKKSRGDYTASESDNMLVQGVAGDAGALGYFGYSYYEVNAGRLRAVAIDAGDGRPFLPLPETVRNGTYKPLARPLFIYVNAQAAQRPEVQAFFDFFIQNARAIVEHPRVQYVALSDALYAAVKKRFAERVAGTVYKTPDDHGRPLEQLFLHP